MSEITEDDEFEYCEITADVWQVKDDGLSYFTLVRGEKLAVVWDAGYGVRDIRGFVEKNVDTPYMVILSHAHPDHIMGSFRFDSAYLPERDMPLVEYYSCMEYRAKLIEAMDESVKNDHEACDMLMNAVFPEFKAVNPGDAFDLGELHAEVIDLSGHSKGSIGLLIREERLLLSGDALNPYLWLFNEGACHLDDALATLEAAALLPFDRFLGGHGIKPLPKSYVNAHINNLKQLTFDESTLQVRVGCETYSSVYEEKGIRSEILYDKNTLVFSGEK